VRQSVTLHFAAKGEKQVLKKERGRYTKEFRAMAMERMKACPNISTLAQELGVNRMELYRWSKEQEPEELPQEFRPERWKGTKKDQEKTKLAEQLQRVKQLLAEKTLEVDFLQGALHRIEARRQQRGNSGATTSTSKSSR
jgi:transposase-like protein